MRTRRVVYTLSLSSVGPSSHEERGGREDRAAAPVTRAPRRHSDRARTGRGQWFFELGSRMGRQAKDKRLARHACPAGRPLPATRASRPSYRPSEAEEGERDGAGRWFLEQRKDSGRA